MGLGIPLLHLLTVDQLKAVLAHEFGHYGGGDTKVGRLVYHTRLGLGRTLEAVDGKAVAALFNVYGRLVMRVSSAVARHQEFAADAFAARATSGRDLADSLQKLDRHGGLFPLFFAANMHPLVEEGYWAPIGTGFSTFLRGADLQQRERAAGDGAARRRRNRWVRHDLRFASADGRARGGAGRAGATRRARWRWARLQGRSCASRIRSSSSCTSQAVDRSDADYVPWEHVTPKVLVPRWQRIARERADILKQVRIESPPASIRDAVPARPQCRRQKVRMMDQSDVVSHVVFAIACGVVTQLWSEAGRRCRRPGLFCEFTAATSASTRCARSRNRPRRCAG
jgi:hypothetical protein